MRSILVHWHTSHAVPGWLQLWGFLFYFIIVLYNVGSRIDPYNIKNKSLFDYLNQK